MNGKPWALGLVAVAMSACIMASCGGTPESGNQVTKRDGTVDSRPDDLDELCQDLVYYKAKSYKYAREGDERAAADASADLAAVTADLSEYRPEDVSKTCARYDTQENLAKYMR